MSPYRLAVVAVGVVLVSVFTASCSSEGPGNADEAVTLAELEVGGVAHQFGVFPNQQGVDSPCVGITVPGANRTTTAMACPTEPTESGEYAGVVELDTGSFVVGYGLGAGETVTTEGATRVAVARDPEGHRLFAIRLQRAPGPEPVEVIVTTIDGRQRTISTGG